ncbi:Rhs family protein [hydrothermal vent metagenome]|uniref:Rhs family protein n=1 Tax=hydrothermal vent metagenome TaxID=652676 RepID=A0A3B0YAX8_9ZZZZ
MTYSNSAENITYSYDDATNGNKGIGRLTSVTEPSGTSQYEYNALGEVTKTTQTINGQTYATEYLFDAAGRASGVIYPSGISMSYAYDNLGQITGVNATINSQAQSIAGAISYLPFGPMKTLTFGNGSVLTNSYDLDYRLTDSTVASLKQNSYSYSLTDNITVIDDALATASNQSFIYDVLDRLDIASGEYGSIDYGYDGVGNRLSKNADTYSYENSSSLQTIFGTETRAFAYDANGNTLQNGNLTFTYNQANRLASATDGAFNASYTYNARGERVAKSVDGVETHYIFNLSGKLIAEADANGIILREYVYFNDAPLAQIVGSDIYYYHNSHLGTPESMTDSTQAVVWSASYTPFGKGTVTAGVVENNLRFPGQYYDQETGLHYNMHRYYDPAVGRYLTADRLDVMGRTIDPEFTSRGYYGEGWFQHNGKWYYDGQTGELNHIYGYVSQNPVNYIDPLGLHHKRSHKFRPPSPPLLLPNGNLWDGYRRQDGTCSLGPLTGLGNSCFPERCLRHDQCYDDNRCNASSWIPTLFGADRSCNQCNRDFFK